MVRACPEQSEGLRVIAAAIGLVHETTGMAYHSWPAESLRIKEIIDSKGLDI
jgi:hypothetical protein